MRAATDCDKAVPPQKTLGGGINGMALGRRRPNPFVGLRAGFFSSALRPPPSPAQRSEQRISRVEIHRLTAQRQRGTMNQKVFRSPLRPAPINQPGPDPPRTNVTLKRR